ncbi:DUF4145 domain-containing protein [Citrobacter freundii]|nr:DUF4145 domain-containing protein [Citrobacter freundii]ELT9544270.1 DUF4145 domain-containing protein [Citrobacter freundii]OCF79295.1 hypothetical protein AS299_15910 [Citrobacter freundii]
MEIENIKALCPNCCGLRNCTVHGKITTSWADLEYPIYGWYYHHLLQCNGCEQVFYHLNEHFSEHTTHIERNGHWEEVPIDMITTFPAIESFSAPEWIAKIQSVDEQLFQILNEMYVSFAKGHYILSSIGLRTIFDRTTEILKIHPGFTLEEKVSALKNDGYIGETEAKVLSSVIDAGNAAAHRGWSPKKSEFNELLDVIEKFVERTVLSKKSLEHITAQLPARQKRPKRIK